VRLSKIYQQKDGSVIIPDVLRPYVAPSGFVKDGLSEAQPAHSRPPEPSQRFDQ